MQNTVKTFPIRMSGEFHNTLKIQAEQEGKSIHQYVIDAINSQLQNKPNKERRK